MPVYTGVKVRFACIFFAAVNFLSTAQAENTSLVHTLLGMAATGILNGPEVHDNPRFDEGEDLRPVVAFKSKKENSDGSLRESACTGISFGKCVITARHCLEGSVDGSVQFFLGREMKTPVSNVAERVVRKIPTSVSGFLSLGSVSGTRKIEPQSDLAVMAVNPPFESTYSYSLSQLATDDSSELPKTGRIVGYGANQIVDGKDGKQNYLGGGIKRRGFVTIQGSQQGKLQVGPDESHGAVNLALPGDSGGPLLVGDPSRPTIQGVAVNYGGDKNTYVDISQNRWFIDMAIKKLGCNR